MVSAECRFRQHEYQQGLSEEIGTVRAATDDIRAAEENSKQLEGA